MSEHTEDKQSIVARLNALEAQYTDAHSAFVAHATPANWNALQDAGDAYEQATQECWDKGMTPLWNKTAGTYIIEECM